MILVSARAKLLDEIRAMDATIEYCRNQNMMTFNPPKYTRRLPKKRASK